MNIPFFLSLLATFCGFLSGAYIGGEALENKIYKGDAISIETRHFRRGLK